jgi:hypothetical protein
MECQRKNGPRLLPDRWDIMQAYALANTTFYRLGECTARRPTAWRVFWRAATWCSKPKRAVHAPAPISGPPVRRGRNRQYSTKPGTRHQFLGLFGTGYGGGATNFLEVGPL